MIYWVIPLISLSILILIFTFILFTDGRYFGKRIMHWVYDNIGSQIFDSRSEADRWESLAKQLQITGQENIIDIGTATGDLPLTLAALLNPAGKIMGIDWSVKMIANAQDKAKKRGLADRTAFIIGDVRQNLPFQTAYFDVVICFGVLETLSQPEEVLRELRRILKPNGKMALSLYRGWSGQAVALDLNWYKSALKQVGMEQVQVVECRQNQDVVIAS